jgi:hypothetical protein
MKRYRICGTIIPCADCNGLLAVRGNGIFGGGWHGGDWCMVKDSVWRQSQRKGGCRFLCIPCLEQRIDRKLSASDFRRSAKVNFVGGKSPLLRRRMRGLKPAKPWWKQPSHSKRVIAPEYAFRDATNLKKFPGAKPGKKV